MVYNCYRIAEVFVVRKKVFIYVKLNCFAPYLIFTYIIHINMYLRENSNLKHLKTKLYQIYRSSQMIWMEYSYALENSSIVFVAKRKKKKLLRALNNYFIVCKKLSNENIIALFMRHRIFDRNLKIFM